MAVRSKEFDIDDLRRIHELDGPNSDNLYSPPHLVGVTEDLLFFSREAWKISTERYNALHQSFLLANKLLRAGHEFTATFLRPRMRVLIEGIRHSSSEPNDSYAEARIRLRNPTQEDMTRAWIELGQVSRYVTFEENPDLLTKGHHPAVAAHGLTSEYTRGDNYLRSLINPGAAEIAWRDKGALSRGQERASFTIVLATEFVDAILSARNERNAAKELKTVFQVAVEIVKMIGRVMFLQDFHNRWDVSSGHPAVNDEIEKDIGEAFLGFIFGGWFPLPALVLNKKPTSPTGLGEALRWYRVKKIGYRPWFNTFYSIPTRWLEKILSQETWDAVSEPKTPIREKTWWSLIRQNVLCPPAPFDPNTHVRGWSNTRVVGGSAIPRSNLQVKAGNFPYMDPDWKPDLLRLAPPIVQDDFSDDEWQPSDDGIQEPENAGTDIRIHDQRPGRRKRGERIVYLLRNQYIVGSKMTVLDIKRTLQNRGIGTVQEMVLTYNDDNPTRFIMENQSSLEYLSWLIDWRKIHLYHRGRVETLPPGKLLNDDKGLRKERRAALEKASRAERILDLKGDVYLQLHQTNEILLDTQNQLTKCQSQEAELENSREKAIQTLQEALKTGNDLRYGTTGVPQGITTEVQAVVGKETPAMKHEVLKMIERLIEKMTQSTTILTPEIPLAGTDPRRLETSDESSDSDNRRRRRRKSTEESSGSEGGRRKRVKHNKKEDATKNPDSTSGDPARTKTTADAASSKTKGEDSKTPRIQVSNAPKTRASAKADTKITTSPKGKDNSPKGKDNSPKGKGSSPKGKDNSPKEKASSPKGKDSSPKGKGSSPRKRKDPPADDDEEEDAKPSENKRPKAG